MIRLTDEQWECIRDPYWRRILAMDVLGANPLRSTVLWILNQTRNGHAAADLPELQLCIGTPRFASRADSANELRDGGALNEEECFIDATFVMAKGGLCQITFWLL
jgi:hypothetical protein